MKKIMICSLTLLPLIILLILSVGGVVVSLSTYIYVENIEFVDNEIVLEKESDDDVLHQLKVNVFPMRANNKEVVFWSENEDIALVDEKGVVSGKSFGETYIYVQSKENSAKTSACKIIITDDKIHCVKVTNHVGRLFPGESLRLDYTFEPIEAKNIRMLWTSSDPSIIEVSPDGVITASNSKMGSVVITVKSEENPEAFYSFSIKNTPKVTGLSIEDTTPVTIGSIKYEFPDVSIYPQEVDEELVYYSTDNSVATVDLNGLVTFKKAGTVTIGAMIEGYAFSVEKQITCTEGYFNSVNFNKTSIETDYEADKKIDLFATYSPLDADLKNLKYSFSKPGVLYEKEGKFYVCGGGNVTVYATIFTSFGTTKTTECSVMVNRNAEDIKFYNAENENTNYIVVFERNYQIVSKLFPKDCTNKKLNYLSSDKDVATVSNGIVSFNRNLTCGEVDVTVSADDGTLSRTLKIVYIDASYNTFSVKKGESTKKVYLPSSTSAQEVSYAPYVNGVGINNVQYFIEGAASTAYDGFVLTSSNKDDYVLSVLVNGEKYADIAITVYRKVENIQASFSELWGGTSSPVSVDANGRIYTSAKQLEFDYTLSPAESTLNVADVSLSKGAPAQLVGNKLSFTGAGRCVIRFFADGVEHFVTVESTYGLLDGNTQCISSLLLNAEDVVGFADLVTKVSPHKADIANVTFSSSDQKVVSVEGHSIRALGGGDAQITISIETPSGQIKKYVSVHVNRVADSIAFLDNYIYTQEARYNLNNAPYSLLPVDANYQTDIAYTLVLGNEYASLNSDTAVLEFSKAGLAVIRFSTGNGVEGLFAIVYTGIYDVIDGRTESVIEYEVGKSFIIKPSAEVRKNIPADTAYTVSNMSLINGVIMSITTPVEDAVTIFNATADLAGNIYKFKGFKFIEGLNLSIENSADYDVYPSGEFVTGLKNLKLSSSVTNADATYKTLSYRTSDREIAEVIADVLTFKKAGTVTVTVYSAFQNGISKELTVRSTFGYLDGVAGDNAITLEYNNNDLTANIVDFKNNLTGKPSQVELTSDLVQLVCPVNAISADGLNVNLLKGGSSSLVVNYKGVDANFAHALTIEVTVERKATGILLNGKDISSIGDVTVGREMYLISTNAFPSDANKFTNISFKIVSGGEYATLKNGNRLVFNAVNQPVGIRFVLGEGGVDKEWTVNVKTTILSETINVDSPTVYVPAEKRFSFYSESGRDLSSATFETIGMTLLTDGENYYVENSGIGVLRVTVEGVSEDINFVVTERLYEISGVSLADVNNKNQAVNIACAENSTHITASSEVTVSCNAVTNALNKNGTVPTISFSITEGGNIATVNALGKVVFTAPGEISLKLMASGEDYYGGYNCEYVIKIKSTFGRANAFTLNNPYPLGLVIDDISSFELSNQLTASLPQYGVLTPVYNYSSNATGVISIDSVLGKATVVGTGTATITVSTLNSDGYVISKNIVIKVDKYIDQIKFVANDKHSYGTVTKQDIYAIELDKLSNTLVNPSLLNVKYSVTSGNATIDNNGVLTFGANNVKCNVRITAEKGNAFLDITLIRVPETVNVVTVDFTTDKVVIEAGNDYVLDFVYSEKYLVADFVDSSISVVDEVTGVFEALYGNEFVLSTTDGSKALNVIITEPVQSVLVGNSAPLDGYLTAKGAEGDAINVFDLYSPSVSPSTARTEFGSFVIECGVQNITGEATLNKGLLTFSKAGTVKVTFSAGGKKLVRTLESTMGYAKDIVWNVSGLNFDYFDASYTILNTQYTVSPADASVEKYAISYTSNDSDIFSVNGNVLTMTGGGNGILTMTYYTSSMTQNTITLPVFVNNSVKDVSFLYEGNVVNYIVCDGTIPLTYKLVYDGKKLSNYAIRFESEDTTTAKVSANGLVEFLKTDVSVGIKLTIVNTDGTDGCSARVIVKNTGYVIEKAYGNKDVTIDVEGSSQRILFPIPEKPYDAYTYEIISGSDVVSINDDVLSAIKGGLAQIKITGRQYGVATDVWVSYVNIYVYRRVTDVETVAVDGSVTSKTNVAISPTILPLDASFNKDIVYVCNPATLATVDSNGNITFLEAGILTVTIQVKHNGVVEYQEDLQIESTFNCLKDFKIKYGGNEINYDSYYIIEDIGQSLSFSIENATPSDYLGSFTATPSSSVLSATISGSTITVNGLSKGYGEISVVFGGKTKTIKINVLKKTTSIKIASNNIVADSFTTLANFITLSADVLPVDASNKNVVWSISGTGATIANGIVTFTAGNYGTYIVTATSQDGASSKSVSVTYAQDISSFRVERNGENIQSGATINLAWNEKNVDLTLFVLPSNLVGDFDYSMIAVSSLNGSVITRNGKYVTITTPSIETQPAFDDQITFTYKSLTTFTLHISRFGVKSVSFVDHDNNLDSTYGLQQVRLFGQRSSYNGSTVNYYKMPVTVEPAALVDKIVWTTSDSAVTVSIADGYACVYLNAFTGNTREEISANIFNRTVTVNATDGKGNVFDTYTFHVVKDAVNVFDKAGFCNNGNVVLHVNLGGSEESGMSKYAPLDTQSGINKSIVYGNGFIVNYYFRNDTYTKDMGNCLSTGLTYAYNVYVKGGNYSADKSNYHNCFGCSEWAYSYVTQTYKGIFAGEGSIIRNCKFMYIKDMSVQVSDQDRKVYIENVISVDGGNVAFESQVESFYFKGFIDVYNFKNKETLGEVVKTPAISGPIINDLKRTNPDYAVTVNDNDWVNAVVFCGKTGGANRPVYFWNSASNSYVAADEGNIDAAPGLKRFKVLALYSIWSTPAEKNGYPKWSEEFNPDGSINNAFLGNVDKKLKRLNG